MKLKWDMKTVIGAIVLLVLLLVVVNSAFASGDRCYKCTINHITEEVYVTEVTSISEFYEQSEGELARATSLSIAHSSLHFGTNTRKLQMGVGGGFYDGEESLVIGAGKYDGEYLYTGSVGHTNGHTSANFAFHWTIE